MYNLKKSYYNIKKNINLNKNKPAWAAARAQAQNGYW